MMQEGFIEIALVSLDKDPLLVLYRVAMSYLLFKSGRKTFYPSIQQIILTIVITYLIEDRQRLLRQFIVHVIQLNLTRVYNLNTCQSYLISTYFIDYIHLSPSHQIFEYLAQLVLLLALITSGIIFLLNKIEERQLAFGLTLIAILKLNFFAIYYQLQANGDTFQNLFAIIFSSSFMNYFFFQLMLLLSLFLINLFSGAKIIHRKLFHFLIFVIVYFGYEYSQQYTKLALATFLWLFIVGEAFRQCFRKELPVMTLYTDFLLQFCDQRDDKELIKTHIYLLMGVSHSIFFSGNIRGVIVLGIGDSFAAIVGFYLGRISYPGGKKTLEGTLAFISSCMIVEYIWSGNLQLIYILVGIVESLTREIDNLLLPAVANNEILQYIF